jgi:hypothetical protein
MKGIILGVLAFGVAGSAMARPELNAFINKPANSIPELIAQIKSDKQVADRFMRHFSMSKEEVLEFVGTLRLGSLQESGYYTIYSAPENGVLKAHISFFKKGTPAFVDADGAAILRVKCANPFVAGKIKAYSLSEPSVSHESSTLGVLPEASMKADSIIANSTPPIPEMAIDNPVTLKTTGINSSPNVFSANPVAAILGLGGAAIFVNKKNPPVVPEPASMIAISLGVGALLLRRKKK